MLKTSDYPYFKFPFAEFNVAQDAVVPFLDKDVNIVIAFNTATGKTAMAEFAFGYHLITNKDSKVIYVSPFKAISHERCRDWKEDSQFAQHGILINTGDDIPEREEYEASRILIMTSESLDAKTRNPSNASWLEKTDCVVFDEAHLLGKEGRGSSIEASIMRLTRLPKPPRIIFLSATMSNAMQVATWLKTISGKATKCIQSNWRPVKIVWEYHGYDDSGDKDAVELDRMKAVAEIVRKNRSEKIIVFVHSKKTGKLIAGYLKRLKIPCAFHNASLSASKREQIEKLFDQEYGGLNVIVATSTLAAGVNLAG